jgi:hypothetical protein
VTHRFEDPTGQYLLIVICQQMELLPANSLEIRQNTETSPNRSNFYTIGFNQFEIHLQSTVPHPEGENPTRHRVMTISNISFTLEFPSIFKTMFQPMRRPNGKLKRIKCGMKCEDVKIRLHQIETNILISAYSHLYGGLENGYRKWQSVIQEGLTKLWEHRVISEQMRADYIQMYRHHRSSSTKSKKEICDLLALECDMPLSTIMSLRRQALQWKFDDLTAKNQVTPTPPVIHFNGDPRDPEFLADLSMAAYLSSKKPHYDDLWAVLREIQFYSRTIVNLQIELYSGTSFGSQDTRLCASLIAERAKFSTALLLCRNPEYPHGSIGATDEICEPLFPWFHCDVGMSNFNISLHSANDVLSSNVFLETQYGFQSLDIHKWQANIDFAYESSGAMALSIECRDTVFNGCLNSDIWRTTQILSDILSKPYLIPTITLEEYFPQDFFHIDSLFVIEDKSISNQPRGPILDLVANYLYLRNIVLASIFDFSNVMILFPDLSSLSKVNSLESNFPTAFAIRFDWSCRILSGKNKEEFNISLYGVDFNIIPCISLPLSSRIYGHYQWLHPQTDEKTLPLLVIEKTEVRYLIRIDDCPLRERKYQDIRSAIQLTWGKLTSRLCVKIETISLLEYTNGHLISLISSPTLDVRIKVPNQDTKLAPTAHLYSKNKNTRNPIFDEAAHFLVDDSHSYMDPMTPFPFLLEFLLIDDNSKERILVAWCQLPSDSQSYGQFTRHPLIESDSRTEIGQIWLVLFSFRT